MPNEANIQLKLDSGALFEDGQVMYQYYVTLEGKRKKMISRVGDGRVIKRFDKTGTAVSGEDIVCPHFLELKWGYGCPLQCAYCYLQGTLRFLPNKKSPTVKNTTDVESAVAHFLKDAKSPEILNTGELADSLMWEKTEWGLTKKIIPLFRGTDHKILIVTKLDWVDNLLDLDSDLKKNIIASFSINSKPVAKRWEIGAPDPFRRITAAKKLFDKGFDIRLRIDPIVAFPEDEWLKDYIELVDEIFNHLIPERITLGSLRGLQSTINNSKDRSWAEYLTERSNWGRRIPFKHRYELFSAIIEYIRNQHNFNNLALCKEPVSMWETLDMDWKHCRCNCSW